LRREEVASLACIGVTWYTWLEQGRNVRPSSAVLERIAKALRLSASDRGYLFGLVAGQAKVAEPLSDTVERAFQLVLESMRTTPAFIVNPRWDVIAFNGLADIIYDWKGDGGRYSTNMIWRTFTDPERRRLYVNWKTQIPRALALVRASYASRLGDQSFEELLRALRHASPEFAQMWALQQTGPLSPEPFELQSDRLGRLSAYSTRFTIPTHPGYTMFVLVPANAATTRAFSQSARRARSIPRRTRRSGK
jgi:transcriptional regulator with XRE-family HTH domain